MGLGRQPLLQLHTTAPFSSLQRAAVFGKREQSACATWLSLSGSQAVWPAFQREPLGQRHIGRYSRSFHTASLPA